MVRDGLVQVWRACRKTRRSAVAILPHQGEVAGTRQTEGEDTERAWSLASPSVAFGATSPWLGRIVVVRD